MESDDIPDLDQMKIRPQTPDNILEAENSVVANEVAENKIIATPPVVTKDIPKETKNDEQVKPSDRKLFLSPKAETTNDTPVKEKAEKASSSSVSIIRFLCNGVTETAFVDSGLASRFNSAYGNPKSTAESLNPLFDEVEEDTRRRTGKALRPDLPVKLQPKTGDKKSHRSFY